MKNRKEVRVDPTVFEKMNKLYGRFYGKLVAKFHNALHLKDLIEAQKILMQFPKPNKKLARIYTHHVINSGNHRLIDGAEEVLGRKLNKHEMNRIKKVGAVMDVIHS